MQSIVPNSQAKKSLQLETPQETDVSKRKIPRENIW